MVLRQSLAWKKSALRIAWIVLAIVGFVAPATLGAETEIAAVDDVTFASDIAPILQRSCQNCHRPDGVAPMALITYEDARPWARAIKLRTGLGPRAGVMPPWYIEKDIGIQKFKDDPSLSEEEIAKLARWSDSGAPRGNPADMPPLRVWDDEGWTIGEPDLIVESDELLVEATTADWWGEIEPVPTGLTEDRYVSAVEVREINDIDDVTGTASNTVGGRWVFHHANYISQVPGTGQDRDFYDSETIIPWPIHEVGRNPDILDPKAGRLLQAGSHIIVRAHLHSNGRDTRARLLFGFKFHPKGYEPTVARSRQLSIGGVDIDVRSMQAENEHHAYMVLQEPMKLVSFEPHLHAPGTRMCMEAIWGIDIQTLVCAGYDHSWVRTYVYADDAAPLLPKGTILHLIGEMNNTPRNPNVADPRNWQGGGNRSVANMFLDLGEAIELTDEQFQQEMAERRATLPPGTDVVLGCPVCMVPPEPAPAGSQ